MNLYHLTGVSGGGWNEAKAELANRTAYPLQDGDNGTWTLGGIGDESAIEDETDENSEQLIKWEIDENYGNCWWFNKEKKTAISWKGPPNGFNISSFYFIPGLSQVEAAKNDIPFYTVFGPYLYNAGVRLHVKQDVPDDEMRTLAVGGCLADDGANKTWLVALTVTNTDVFTFKVRRTNDSGTTWHDIYAELLPSRAKTTAFISTDGHTFVFNGKRYTLDGDLLNCKITETVPVVESAGTRTVAGTGGYKSSYTYHGTSRLWPGMGVDTSLVYSDVTVEAVFNTTDDSSGGIGVKYPVYFGNPAKSLTIMRDAEPSAVNCAGAAVAGKSFAVFHAVVPTGNYCSIKWSNVDCQSKDGKMAMKMIDSCNQSYSVTATLLPQGVSATLEREAQTKDIAIGGPTNSGDVNAPGIGRGTYTVANAFGTVFWSVSCGTIYPDPHVATVDAVFTGCGCPQKSVTVSVIDECGRRASIEVMTATSGTWLSNNDHCCINYSDVPDELKPSVICDIYQCNGASRIFNGILESYQAYPGWGYSYAVACNSCGPQTGTSKETFHWVCP